MIKFKSNLFMIVFVMVLFNLISCSERETGQEAGNPSVTYRTEITYTGDTENWKEELNINTKINSDKIPKITGVELQKTEKNDAAHFTFYLPAQMIQNKAFEISDNIEEIRMTCFVTPLKPDVKAISAHVKVFKNQNLLDEFTFKFDQNSPLKYYILNAK